MSVWVDWRCWVKGRGVGMEERDKYQPKTNAVPQITDRARVTFYLSGLSLGSECGQTRQDLHPAC